jgi:Uma2 family endonuclease
MHTSLKKIVELFPAVCALACGLAVITSVLLAQEATTALPENYKREFENEYVRVTQFEDDVLDTLLNPRSIIEVLSDSTERYDRGDKFASYRLMPSFTEYLKVSSKLVRIEHFTRESDGSWRLREYASGDRFAITSLGIELAVDDLYRKVFEEAGTG